MSNDTDVVTELVSKDTDVTVLRGQGIGLPVAVDADGDVRAPLFSLCRGQGIGLPVAVDADGDVRAS